METRAAPPLFHDLENGFGDVRMVDYVSSVKSHDKKSKSKRKKWQRQRFIFVLTVLYSFIYSFRVKLLLLNNGLRAIFGPKYGFDGMMYGEDGMMYGVDGTKYGFGGPKYGGV